MSNPGPREVKEPAPPNRKPKLSKKGKALKKKVKHTLKNKLTKEQQELREKALADPKLALYEYPEKLDKKTLEEVALKEPMYALMFPSFDYLDEELRKKCALESPSIALVELADKFDKDFLDIVALTNPYDVLKFIPNKVRYDILKKCAFKLPSIALEHASDYFDDKTINELALKEPSIAIEEVSDRINEKNMRNLAAKAYPFIYGNKEKEFIRGGETKTTITALFNKWVNSSNGFISDQFRDNVADIFKLKNVSKRAKKFVAFPERTKKAIENLYKDTQKLLKKDFPSGYVTLYRGTKSGIDIPYAFNSFSSKRDIADRFDGHDTIETKVPIKKILSYHKSGSITKLNAEKEYIVMGNYNEF